MCILSRKSVSGSRRKTKPMTWHRPKHCHRSRCALLVGEGHPLFPVALCPSENLLPFPPPPASLLPLRCHVLPLTGRVIVLFRNLLEFQGGILAAAAGTAFSVGLPASRDVLLHVLKGRAGQLDIVIQRLI